MYVLSLNAPVECRPGKKLVQKPPQAKLRLSHLDWKMAGGGSAPSVTLMPLEFHTHKIVFSTANVAADGRIAQMLYHTPLSGGPC
jgi:hypothetical protein